MDKCFCSHFIKLLRGIFFFLICFVFTNQPAFSVINETYSNYQDVSYYDNVYGGVDFPSGTDLSEFVNCTFENNNAISYYGAAQGGALYNNSSAHIDQIIDTLFIGNYTNGNTWSEGGAIWNSNSSSIGKITGSFKNNYSTGTFGGSGNITHAQNVAGGAIYNNWYSTIGDIYADFENNYVLGSNAKGGAISNSSHSAIGHLIGNFKGNYVSSPSKDALGGAIYNNDHSNIAYISGEFSGNSSAGKDWAEGGAIWNSNSSVIGDIAANFIDNYVDSTLGGVANGGAIYNNSNSRIGIITGNFVNNKALGDEALGGAIYNLNNSQIQEIRGSFVNNYTDAATLSKGGAILNEKSTIGKIDAYFYGNSAISKTPDALGGAIANNNGAKIESINGEFSNNKAFGEGWVEGGAIWNSNLSEIGNISADFVENGAVSYGGNPIKGGALYNGDNSIIRSLSGNFKNNYIIADNNAYGGAIFNCGDIYLLDNATFIGNKVDSINGEASGAAIYNYSQNGRVPTINIASNNGHVIFTDNVANNVTNGIYNEGIINMNAGDYKIIVNDGIVGDLSAGIINLNKNNVDISVLQDGSNIAQTSGIIEINNIVDGNTVNFYNGTLRLGHYNYGQLNSQLTGQTGVGGFSSNSALNIYGGKINTQDGSTYNHSLGNVSLESDIAMQIDADLLNSKVDNFTVNSFNNPNSSIIEIDDINFLSLNNKDLSISIVSDPTSQDDIDFAKTIKYTGKTNLSTPISNYAVGYDEQTGRFNFKMLGYNPSVFVSSVALQSMINNIQDISFGQAFYGMDSFMMQDFYERNLYSSTDKYAKMYSYNKQPIEEMTRRYNREAWYRPYVNFETVPLRNGPRFDNLSHGAYFGTNSRIKRLSLNWDGAWGVYFGYNHSKQSYDDIDIINNGGTIGVVGEFYRKNLFTGITLNVGATHANADTMFGKENFTMIGSGLAVKTGYNFEFLERKYIVQPNFILGYSFAKALNYTNAANVDINADMLNALHLEPGIKFIANVDEKCKPYISLSAVFNTMDKTGITANKLSLPETSIKPYIKYGFGIQKRWSEKIFSFFQAFATSGGRDGIGFQGGLTIMF